MVSINLFTPAKALSNYVACYTEGVLNTPSMPDATFNIVPNGCLELIIHLKERYCQLPYDGVPTNTPDYMLIGLFPKSYKIKFQEPVPIFSIRFKVEAIPLLFRLKGSELLESYEDVEMVLGKKLTELCNMIREEDSINGRIALADNFLMKLMSGNGIDMDYVQRAASLMREYKVNNVEDLSRSVYISQRQLERKFKNDIGISPKHYLRIVRFNKAMRILQQHRRSLDLTSLAYNCGYFDQAHFIKEFKHFTGESPGIYIDKMKDQNYIYASPEYL